MKIIDIITEGRNHPIIVVDVQPEYEQPIFEKTINFVNSKTGPVLMFINAEKTGVSSDTKQDVIQYWNATVCGEEYEYDKEADEYIEKECENAINWSRFTIVDKGYGYFRALMDEGIPDNIIIRLIRKMYYQKVSDIRELYSGEGSEEYTSKMKKLGIPEELQNESFSINWTSVAQLKKFSGAYIVGGGRNECLREIELLMSAFNIKYKRIEKLVY